MDNDEKKEEMIPSVELKFSKEPTQEELDEILKKRNEIFRQLGYELDNDGKFISSKSAGIIYFKLTSGVTLKIDKDNFTCYRFNQERQEWQEDSVLFTEYEHGNLEGQEIMMEDNYPYGEPFHFGRSL